VEEGMKGPEKKKKKKKKKKKPLGVGMLGGHGKTFLGAATGCL